MEMMQVIDPPAWAGLRHGTIHVKSGSHAWEAPGAAMEVFLGPSGAGPAVLALDARGDLSEVTSAGVRPRLTGLTAADADPDLLVAAYAGGILELESARACTTITLPEDALLVAAAGAEPPGCHLAVVVLSRDTWLLAWDEASARITFQRVAPGCPKGAWLFRGSPGLMALRMPWGACDRMLLWHVAQITPRSFEIVQLPHILVAPAIPTGLRHVPGSPMVLGGHGTWLALEGVRWCETGETLGGGSVPSRVFGSLRSFEPCPWLGEEASPRPHEVGGRPLTQRSDDGHVLPRRLADG